MQSLTQARISRGHQAENPVGGQVLALPVPGFPACEWRMRTACDSEVSRSPPVEAPRIDLPNAGTDDILQTASLLYFKIKMWDTVL